jgi:uncharacterized protein YecE (DUF72 family)
MENSVENLLKIGTIGFGYSDWDGSFYPSGLPTREYLKFYSQKFNALEIDTTFYGTPKAETVARWNADTDENFTFCVKTPRTITHQMGLIGTRGLMSEFSDSVRPFGDKLGAILIQLPPRFTVRNTEILHNFLQEIPNDLRFAIEFRNLSWYTKDTFQLLSNYDVGWVITEYPGLPLNIWRTTDFLYIRWIGEHGAYTPHTHERVDKSSQLEWWWDQIQPHLNHIKAFYGFFNNDYAGFAAGTCKKFMKVIGLPVQENIYPEQKSFL